MIRWKFVRGAGGASLVCACVCCVCVNVLTRDVVYGEVEVLSELQDRLYWCVGVVCVC